jgi:hypothetical protein
MKTTTDFLSFLPRACQVSHCGSPPQTPWSPNSSALAASPHKASLAPQYSSKAARRSGCMTARRTRTMAGRAPKLSSLVPGIGSPKCQRKWKTLCRCTYDSATGQSRDLLYRQAATIRMHFQCIPEARRFKMPSRDSCCITIRRCCATSRRASAMWACCQSRSRERSKLARLLLFSSRDAETCS